jgi:hypothetical protein
LIKDAIRTKNWVDKIRVWFMPTGWRPKDIEEKYPVFYLKADDVYNFEKYNPRVFKKISNLESDTSNRNVFINGFSLLQYKKLTKQ